MGVDDKQVKDFEEKYKEILFGNISTLSSHQTQLLSQIEYSKKYTNIDSNLPNISITLNNKLVELSHIFKDAGISMFSSKVEDYSYVSSSFIGEALIINMFSKITQATRILEEYTSTLQQITDKKHENSQALEKITPIKLFFLKIRSLIIPASKIDLSFTKEETQKLNHYLSEYKEIDEQLWNYNLKDDMIPSLVSYIEQHGYSKDTILGILDECIIPDLQKLGLTDLIPQLKSELDKESSIQTPLSNKSWELSPMQKSEIQKSQQKIAKKHNLNQNIAEKKEEQPKMMDI